MGGDQKWVGIRSGWGSEVGGDQKGVGIRRGGDQKGVGIRSGCDQVSMHRLIYIQQNHSFSI